MDVPLKTSKNVNYTPLLQTTRFPQGSWQSLFQSVRVLGAQKDVNYRMYRAKGNSRQSCPSHPKLLYGTSTAPRTGGPLAAGSGGPDPRLHISLCTQSYSPCAQQSWPMCTGSTDQQWLSKWHSTLVLNDRAARLQWASLCSTDPCNSHLFVCQGSLPIWTHSRMIPKSGFPTWLLYHLTKQK